MDSHKKAQKAQKKRFSVTRTIPNGGQFKDVVSPAALLFVPLVPFCG
jgi:hypothetical protein